MFINHTSQSSVLIFTYMKIVRVQLYWSERNDNCSSSIDNCMIRINFFFNYKRFYCLAKVNFEIRFKDFNILMFVLLFSIGIVSYSRVIDNRSIWYCYLYFMVLVITLCGITIYSLWYCYLFLCGIAYYSLWYY